MIILTVRTDKPVAEIGLYQNDSEMVSENWEAHRQLAETIHFKIKSMLASQELNWKDISGIVVFAGPGSFTGLRIGVSVVNALAYVNNIPIIAAKGDEWLEYGIKELMGGANQKVAEVFYGSDAHVTMPKK